MNARVRHIASLIGLLILCSPYLFAQTQITCDNTPSDQTKFQTASTNASNYYATHNGAPVTITYEGQCQINGTVSVGSGVHWRGYGKISVAVQTPQPTFLAANADDVEWDHVEISYGQSYSDSSPFASGIMWYSQDSGDSVTHHHVRIVHCRVTNSSWGITVVYNQGFGSLEDVEITHNTVSSPAVYTNWDGIHVGGAVTSLRINDNAVANRGDAAIALTSESTQQGLYVLSGATIQNNTATENLVGIDLSGATNVTVSGNRVQALTAQSNAQNPAFRQIAYAGVYPVNIHTIGNYFESGLGASFTTKIDPAMGQPYWPPLNSVFEGNTVYGSLAFYVRGTAVIISGNTFLTNNGMLAVDYDGGPSRTATSNVIVGTNRWLGNANIHIGGDSSLIQNVKVGPQLGTGSTTFTNSGNVIAIPD